MERKLEKVQGGSKGSRSQQVEELRKDVAAAMANIGKVGSLLWCGTGTGFGFALFSAAGLVTQFSDLTGWSTGRLLIAPARLALQPERGQQTHVHSCSLHLAF